jgi:transposase
MMRPPGTAAELERRRRRAVELFDHGESPADIARILGVDRSSIYRWRHQARSSPNGLAAKPHPGRPPLLNAAQLAELEALLLQGAPHHGWPTDLWTAERVAQLIRQHFQVALHPEHVRKILRARLGWTSQKPQRRARERNDQEVERWKADEFPRILRDSWRRHAHLVFLDESGFQLTPSVRRTLAPRGRTPIHHCWDRRDRIAAISCITVSARAARLGLYFDLLEDNTTVHAEDVVRFLRALHRHLPGPLTIVWDRSTLHDKSLLVRAYLAEHPEIVTEKFPSYAPDLNPDELVWGHTKYGRLANLAAWTTDDLRDHLIAELVDLRHNPTMLAGFVNHVNLPLRL